MGETVASPAGAGSLPIRRTGSRHALAPRLSRPHATAAGGTDAGKARGDPLITRGWADFPLRLAFHGVYAVGTLPQGPPRPAPRGISLGLRGGSLSGSGGGGSVLGGTSGHCDGNRSNSRMNVSGVTPAVPTAAPGRRSPARPPASGGEMPATRSLLLSSGAAYGGLGSCHRDGFSGRTPGGRDSRQVGGEGSPRHGRPVRRARRRPRTGTGPLLLLGCRWSRSIRRHRHCRSPGSDHRSLSLSRAVRRCDVSAPFP
jgi:hypothetical protein